VRNPLRAFATALLLRRLSADLGRIAIALDLQTTLLARLVDRLAPVPLDQSPADRATLRADTGVSHLDVTEQALALDFVARTQSATGHTPDDEEILIYLADEKTHDLAARLAQRDEELTRLAEARR
jgi:thioredoxin-like negative regulator of GroEL